MGLPAEEKETGALVEGGASSWAWVAPPLSPFPGWASGKEIWEALVLQAEKPEVRLRTQPEEGEGVTQECFPFPGGHRKAGPAVQAVWLGASTELGTCSPKWLLSTDQPTSSRVWFPRRSHRVTWRAPRCPLGGCCG